MERKHISDVVSAVRSKREAAKVLGIAPSTLYLKLKKYGIEMVAAEGYEPKEVDLSSQVISLKNAGVDGVLCSCAPEPAAKVYTERAKHAWNVPVVNVFFGKSPKVAELAGNDAVNGVYFATIFTVLH